MGRTSPLAMPIATLFLLSLGFFLAVFGGLLGDNVAHQRAQLSVWPFLLLAGWAVALFVLHAPRLSGSGWASLWIGGLIAYAVHFVFSFGGVYGWSFEALILGQGPLIGPANIALLVVWVLSALAWLLVRRLLWLHLAVTVLLAAMMVGSTVFLGGTAAIGVGIGLVLIWLGAAYFRFARREATPG
jgi:hypothetical protein